VRLPLSLWVTRLRTGFAAPVSAAVVTEVQDLSWESPVLCAQSLDCGTNRRETSMIATPPGAIHRLNFILFLCPFIFYKEERVKSAKMTNP
jgi:hypothetical protein